jgi:ankyrin repeat protein
MLLTQHEDVRATDKDGWTPLHFVSYTGAVGIVKLLVKKGADVAARHEGERPR